MSVKFSAFEPWSQSTHEFELTDVRLVATLHSDGRLFIENVARLICSEGRRDTYRFCQHGQARSMDYNFSFMAPSAANLIPLTQDPAQVCLSGYLGRAQVEISGLGWISYDEQARLGGRFWSPPAIAILDDLTGRVAAARKEPRAICTIIPFPLDRRTS